MNKFAAHMKSVLPNTIRPDKRQEQLYKPYGTMDILSKLNDSVDTLDRLLQILERSSKTTELSDLVTSDVKSPGTILAAAYLIKEQISGLRN